MWYRKSAHPVTPTAQKEIEEAAKAEKGKPAPPGKPAATPPARPAAQPPVSYEKAQKSGPFGSLRRGRFMPAGGSDVKVAPQVVKDVVASESRSSVESSPAQPNPLPTQKPTSKSGVHPGVSRSGKRRALSRGSTQPEISPSRIGDAPAAQSAVARPATREPADFLTAFAEGLGIPAEQAHEPRVRSRLDLLRRVLDQDEKLAKVLSEATSFYRHGRPGTVAERVADGRGGRSSADIRQRLGEALADIRRHVPEVLARIDRLDSEAARTAEQVAQREIDRLASNAHSNGDPELAAKLNALKSESHRDEVLAVGEVARMIDGARVRAVAEFFSGRAASEGSLLGDAVLIDLKKASMTAVGAAAAEMAKQEAARLVAGWRREVTAPFTEQELESGVIRRSRAPFRLGSGPEAARLALSVQEELTRGLLADPASTGAPRVPDLRQKLVSALRESIEAGLEKQEKARVAREVVIDAVSHWRSAKGERIRSALNTALVDMGMPRTKADSLAQMVSSDPDPIGSLASRLESDNPGLAAEFRRAATDPVFPKLISRLDEAVAQYAKDDARLLAITMDEGPLAVAQALGQVLDQVKVGVRADAAMRWKPTDLMIGYEGKLAASQHELAAAQSASDGALGQARRDIESARETIAAANLKRTGCEGRMSAIEVRLGVLRRARSKEQRSVRQYDDYWWTDVRRLTERGAYDSAKQRVGNLQSEIGRVEDDLAKAKVERDAQVPPKWATDISQKSPEELVPSSIIQRLSDARSQVTAAQARVDRAKRLIPESKGIGRIADDSAVREMLRTGQGRLIDSMESIVRKATDLDVRGPEMDANSRAMAAAQIVIQAGDLIGDKGLGSLSDDARRHVVGRITDLLKTLGLDSITILETGSTILGALSQVQDKTLFRGFLRSVANIETAAASYQYGAFARGMEDLLKSGERIAQQMQMDLDAEGFYRKAGEILIDFLPVMRQDGANAFMPEGSKSGDPWLLTAEELRPLLRNAATRSDVLDRLAEVQQLIHDGKPGSVPKALLDVVAAVRKVDPNAAASVIDAVSKKLGSIVPGFGDSIPVLRSLLQRPDPPRHLFDSFGRVLEAAKAGATPTAIGAVSDFLKSSIGAGIPAPELDKLLGSGFAFLRSQPGLGPVESLLKLDFMRPAGALTAGSLDTIMSSVSDLHSSLSKSPPDIAGSVKALGSLVPPGLRDAAFGSFKELLAGQLAGLPKVLGPAELDKTLRLIFDNAQEAMAFVQKAQELSTELGAGHYPQASRRLSEMYVLLGQKPAFANLKEQFKTDAMQWVKAIPGASGIVNLDRVDQVISDPVKVETIVQSVLDIKSAADQGNPGAAIQAVGRLAAALPEERDALIHWLTSSLRGISWLNAEQLAALIDRGAEALNALEHLHNAASKGDLPGQLSAIGQLVGAVVDPEMQARMASDAADTIMRLMPPLKEAIGKRALVGLLRSDWGAFAGTIGRLGTAIEKGRIVEVLGETQALVDKLPAELKSEVAVKLFQEIAKKIPALSEFGKVAGRLEKSGALGHFLKLLDHMTHNQPTEAAKDFGEIMKSLTATEDGLLLLGDALGALLKLLPRHVEEKLLLAAGAKALGSAIPIANILVAAVGAGVELAEALPILSRADATPTEKAIALAKVANAAVAAIPGVGGVVSGAGDIIITLLQFSQAFDFNSLAGGGK